MRPKENVASLPGVAYLSRWSGAESAAEFAAIYAKAISKRYQHVTAAEGEKLPADLQRLQTLTGAHKWETEDGAVVIEIRGNMVLITEAVDQGTTEKMEQAVFAAK